MLERCELMLRLRKGHGIYIAHLRDVVCECSGRFFFLADDIKADKSGNGSFFFPFQRCRIIATALSLRNFRNSRGTRIYLSVFQFRKSGRHLSRIIHCQKPILSEEVFKNNLPWFSVTLIPNFESEVFEGKERWSFDHYHN